MTNRREFLRTAGAGALALGAASVPLGWVAGEEKKQRRILMFTKSEGFQHSVVTRGSNGQLSLAERLVTEFGKKHGFDVKCEKDGRVFVNDDLNQYDAFFFETQGDLSKEGGKDGTPGIPAEGKQKLLDAIAKGKGFVGCHCASDTYHSKGPRDQNQSVDERDPYIQMVGGEFIVHGAQQKARIKTADPHFPGAKEFDGLELQEEWYALKNFADDLHVILVMDTEGMKGNMYTRPAFPQTWIRKHHDGRVFFTSFGHREDIWENPKVQDLILGGIAWAVGNAKADTTPNIKEVTPHAWELKKA